MSSQLLINLIIALIWMFLNDAWTVSSFVSGFAIGLLIVYLMRGFFPTRFYLKGIFAAINLVLIFIKELILSSLDVLKQILAPRLNIEPGIFSMDVDLKNDWEVTLLSSLITLTPGTLVIDVSHDNKTLFVHAMHLDDVEKIKNDINNTFVKAIQEVTAK